jgi:RNA polymerase sigma factor (sigma-70 family)
VTDPPLHDILCRLRRAAGAADAAAVSDALLLERFVRDRDAAAFELLMWRHQHLVLGVCRRVLPDRHDADDAFQATFLTLVRKAAAVGRGSLAGWLAKVAYRCALRVRAEVGRRRERERLGMDLTAVAGPTPSTDPLGSVVEAELQRLPEKYRTPLVLCYLHGATYDEAARQLGCPKGTLSTRLTKARDLLRRRLAGQGVVLPVAGLTGILNGRAEAPAALVAATARAAALVVAGAPAAGAVSAHVLAAAEGVVRSMSLGRLKALAAVLVVLVALGAGASVLVHTGRAEPPVSPRAPAPRDDAGRLYRQLFTRPAHDGEAASEQEELEPPFTSLSKFLTEGESHKQALAALDDFLRSGSEKDLTPVQRALLQRDLWAVLATSAGGTRQRVQEDAKGRVFSVERFEDDGGEDLERPRERRELQKRLARAMRRLALSRREIEALPDNLADAVKAGAFPREFDPKHPDEAFLPPDLAREGEWLGIANWLALDGLATPQHTAFTKGRSVFTVRLRLPAGREATAAYLKKAAAGDLGQFPDGTQVALVRRLVLIDDAGVPRPTRLTESVELRYFRQGKDIGAPAVFVLSRKDLAAGHNGGLRPVTAEETTRFSFQAQSGRLGGPDPLKGESRQQAQRLLESCSNCHARKDGLGGVHSLRTASAGPPGEPQGLLSSDDDDQEKATLRWLRKTYTWGLVQGLWEGQPAKE